MSGNESLSKIDAAMKLAEGAAANSRNAVLYAWFQLFKTAQIHALDNAALTRPVEMMANLATRYVASEGRLSLQTTDRAAFVNGKKLKLTTEEYALATGAAEFFAERGMGGFTIDAPLAPDAIRTLLGFLIYAPPQERRFERLEATIRAAGIPFHINKPLEIEDNEADLALERRSLTFLTYTKLAVLYGTLLADEKLNANRRHYLMKKIARTVQSLVDICLADSYTFLAVSSVKDPANYAPHHAANTAILSIALGRTVGLTKTELADTGLAAVFHDVGLHTCAGEFLDKRAPLDQKERFIVDQHPIQSVDFLLDEKRFNRGALTRVITAFEHHRLFAGTGYPPASRRPHLISRIVTIAGVYDALTTERPWRKAYLPDEAILTMVENGGKEFDPVLLKALVNTLGLYPTGTLVRLDSGGPAIVVHAGGAERATRPVVVLVGRDRKPGEIVDLLERAGGDYRRRIVGTDDPARYGVRPSGILALV